MLFVAARGAARFPPSRAGGKTDLHLLFHFELTTLKNSDDQSSHVSLRFSGKAESLLAMLSLVHNSKRLTPVNSVDLGLTQRSKCQEIY